MDHSIPSLIGPSRAALLWLARGYAVLAEDARQRGEEGEAIVLTDMALTCMESAALAPDKVLPVEARERVREITRADDVMHKTFLQTVFQDP